MNRYHAGLVRAAFALSAVILLSGCRQPADPQLQVMATTAQMGSVLKEVGGDHVKVNILIPPGSCPGHFDMRPDDARALARSIALFTHGYEQFVPRLMESAGSSGPQVRKVGVEGNWMLPEVRRQAISEVARILSEIDHEHRSEYSRRAAESAARISVTGEQLRRECRDAGLEDRTVICSDQQAPVLKWMGFEVVSTYGRPEEFTPNLLHRLTRLGRERKVQLIVDNMQSGPTAGKQLAAEIGAAHVTLSNFPGGYPGTEKWEECLADSVQRVIQAVNGGE